MACGSSASTAERSLPVTAWSKPTTPSATPLKLGQVRGVAMLAAANCGLPVAEYAPLTIKSSVVGYGLASKEQVQFMVARLLDLEEAPKPADAADALAIAICHIHHAQTAEHMRR